jgi:CRISPR/Cas system-associated exonuclease Cas4 (RecB family)
MNDPLLLSRSRLASFLVCQRQFQLRVLERLTWPENPLRQADEARLERGQQFHQLLERHFLGLAIEAATIAEPQVRNWWLVFANSQLNLPHGRTLPELSLTIPIGNHLLNGRFDLLIVGEADGKPLAHIVDWKTGKPQAEADLRHDWQTRLYLAMLAESGEAVVKGLTPEQIGMTYWYVAEPEAPRTIQYSQNWHDRNWAELETLVTNIDNQLATAGSWPLTDDWSHCRNCIYQVYCGRQEAGTTLLKPDELDELEAEALFGNEFLEPELP